MSTVCVQSSSCSCTADDVDFELSLASSPGVDFVIEAPGMPYVVGHGQGMRSVSNIVTPLSAEHSVLWTAIRLDNVTLSQQAHMMIIEGAPLSWFLVGATVRNVRDDTKLEGVFLLLKGDTPPLHQVPYRLKNVVLGHLHASPKHANPSQLLPALFAGIPSDLLA